jgi:APA family basic amino acid/polyamine antiporter
LKLLFNKPQCGLFFKILFLEDFMANTENEKNLKKELGFGQLFFMTVGIVIGGGVLSLTGFGIGFTGTGVWLAYLIAAALMIIGSLPMAQLGAIMPGAGGNYRYSSRLCGSWAGWVENVAYIVCYVFCLTFWNLTFAAYFQALVPSANQYVVAGICLTVFFIINMTGTKRLALVETILSVALLVSLALYICFGLAKSDFSVAFNPAYMFPNGAGGMIGTVVLLGMALSGAANIGDLGGEMKNPGVDIPKVIISVTAIVGVAYAVIGVVSSSVLPIENVAFAPLTVVADFIFPKPIFYLFVIGGALGAMATTINGVLAYITKPLIIAAQDGWMPKIFASVDKKTGIPRPALIAFYAVGMIILIVLALGSETVVAALGTANYVGTAFGFVYFSFSCAGLLVVMAKYPQMYRKAPFKLPVWLIYPLCIWGLINAVLSFIVFFLPPGAFNIGLGMLNIKNPVVYIMLIVIGLIMLGGLFYAKKVPITMDYVQPESYKET